MPDAPALIDFTRTVFGAVEIAKHLDEQGQSTLAVQQQS
jgi:hypothetical protein